jgi:hypothetical protein
MFQFFKSKFCIVHSFFFLLIVMGLVFPVIEGFYFLWSEELRLLFVLGVCFVTFIWALVGGMAWTYYISSRKTEQSNFSSKRFENSSFKEPSLDYLRAGAIALICDCQMNWAIAKGVAEKGKEQPSYARFFTKGYDLFLRDLALTSYSELKKLFGDTQLLLHYLNCANRRLDEIKVEEDFKILVKEDIFISLRQMKKILLNFIKYSEKLGLNKDEEQDLRHLKELISSLQHQLDPS